MHTERKMGALMRGLTSTTWKAIFDINHMPMGICHSLVSESQMQLLTAFSIHTVNNKDSVGT